MHPEPSLDYSLKSYDGDGDEQPRQIVAPVAKHGHAQPKSFAAATAEATGQSKRDINRNVARAEAIGPDILKLSGTSQVQAVVPTPTKVS